MDKTPVLKKDPNESHKTKALEIFLFVFNSVSSNAGFFLIGYYMFFSQNVLGLAASILGIIAAFMRVWNGITAPFVGIMIDRTASKWGKFRPFMAFGYIIMAVSLLLIFTTPVSWPVVIKYGYTTVLYVAFIVGYSCQVTVTRAAQVVLTKDPTVRPLYSQYQSVIVNASSAALPFLLTTLMAPLFPGKLLNADLWRWIAVFVIVLMGLSTLLAMRGLKNIDTKQHYAVEAKQRVSFKDMFEVIIHNRPLQMMVIQGGVGKIGIMIGSTVNIYLFSNLLQNVGLMGAYQMVFLIPTILFSVYLIQFTKKLGMRKPYIWFTLVGMLLGIVQFIIGVRPETVIPFLAIQFVSGFLGQVGNYLSSPMLADITDYETYRSGRFVPGIVSTVYTFFDTMVSALSTVIVGLTLSLSGLGTVKLPTDKWISWKFYWLIMALYFVPGIVAGIVKLVCMHYYPLTKEKMEDVQAELVKRNLKI